MSKKIFIISGPSGAGEDSVIKGLEKIMPIEKIITTTTRSMRPGEIEGQDYYFVTHAEFKHMIEADEFVEYAQTDRGQYYGGTKQEMERILKSDKVGIWKIEYQGVIRAKQIMPEKIVAIFIHIPPDLIADRLRIRGEQDEEFIKNRIEYSQGWYDNQEIFDHIVKNEEGKLEQTIQKVANIIEKESK